MKVSVCVRRVPDPEAQFHLDGTQVNLEGIAWMLDPVDASAVEAGAQVADQHGGEVTVIAVGGDEEDETLRDCLARGATHAVRVDRPAPANCLEAGVALAEALAGGEQPDLVICGASSSDYRGGATGAVIASRLQLPVVQNVIAIDAVDDGSATVQRRRDGGFREVVRVSLPAVLTVDVLVAQPRFPTTQARLRARRADIAVLSPAGGDPGRETQTMLGYQTPPPSRHGIAQPDLEADARTRLRFLLKGGDVRSTAGAGVATGSADELAETIAAFLRERGFIGSV